MRIIRIIIIIPFIIFAEEEYIDSTALLIAEKDSTFLSVMAQISNQSNDKSYITLSLESAVDVYGIQFYFHYNPFEIKFEKDK